MAIIRVALNDSEAYFKAISPWWHFWGPRGNQVTIVGGRGWAWAVGGDLWVVAHEGEHDNVLNGADPIPFMLPITLTEGESLAIVAGKKRRHLSVL